MWFDAEEHKKISDLKSSYFDAGKIMKIILNEENELQLEEVYNGILLKINDDELIDIYMRDGGFEFKYQNKWYSAKEGRVKHLDI